jgi:hypothetical protein
MSNLLNYAHYLKIPFSSEVFFHYRDSLILFLVIIILSYIIDFYLSHSFFGPKYRYFLAPGVIIHELSHAFACLLTGAKVTQLSVFDKKGGHVNHTRSKIPLLGSVIISTAPLIVGIIIIYIMSRKLGLSDFDFLEFGNEPKSILLANIMLVKNISHFSVKNWLLLYLTISVAVTMVPSRKDFANAFIPLVILTLAFMIISKYMHILLPVEPLNILFFTTINLLIIGLVLSIVIFALTNIFRY